MSSKRRPRPTSARSPKSKGPDSTLAAEGIYSNPYFMNSVVALVGSAVKVHTASGSVYEGILRTFSPQFDVVVELAHKVDPNNSMHICVESVVGKMVFKQQGIVKIAVADQDLDYATKDTFQTDTAISKYNGQLGEKELEPWDATTSPGDNDYELDGASNGWDVNDMFRQNEEAFGVTSSYDHGLAGYTTPLHKESKEYKEAEAKASKIASEIESSTYYKNRIELENGDEEETFAAVVRPSHLNNNDGHDNSAIIYVPPHKRMNPSSQGPKSTRTSSSSPPNSTTTHHHSSNKNTTSSPVVSSHPQTTLPPQHSSQTAPSNNNNVISNVNRTDRVNGGGNNPSNPNNGNGGGNPMYESPKPQRANVRHGRNNYTNNDSSRSTSNGSMSSPSSTISSASSSTVTNHSDQQPQQHHRNPPPPGPSSYGAPQSGPIISSSMVVNSSDHKSQHNQPPSYQNNSNMVNSPAPSPHQQVEQHSRNPHYGHNINMNQSNDYRGNQVHNYVHSCALTNSMSSNEQQYIQQGQRAVQHYQAHQMPSSPANDPRGQPHYGPIPYSVPIMAGQATVVEMRAPQNQDEGPPQMMGPPTNQLHYRKPPTVTPHTVVDHGPPSNVGPAHRAQVRRRKEINELKAFSQDYTLAEPEEVAAVLAAKRSPHGAPTEDDMGGNSRKHDGQSELHNQQGMQRPPPAKQEQKVVKSKLNPNAKEFVYNPPKQYTPSMTTPSQSRPHTPQTPAGGYAPTPPQALGHPIPMVMPAYVVTTQPPYLQPPAQQPRFQKVHMGVASQPSQMQVAAATGQPLLAPAPLPPFTVPYPQGYIPQPFQSMVRIQHSHDLPPPAFTTVNFPGHEGALQAAQMPFMAAPPQPPPAAQHPQHPPMLHHPPQNNASSPQSNGNNQMSFPRPRGW